MESESKNKLEEFYVPARPLTDEEMRRAAYETFKTADSVYKDDPGVWPTFAEFLAFRIGVDSITNVYEGRRSEMEKFATLVMEMAKKWNTQDI